MLNDSFKRYLVEVRILLIAISSFLTTCLYGQEGVWQIYTDFRAFQVNNHVQVDFGIIAGASCNGARLQRLDPEGNFISINEIQGICGGTEFTEYYSFTDPSPIPYRMNTYRIEFGFQQGYSRPLDISFVPLDNGLSIYPNPCFESCTIRFENISSEAVELMVYRKDGSIMYTHPRIIASELYLDVATWSPGMYSFSLSVGDQPIKRSKIMVKSGND